MSQSMITTATSVRQIGLQQIPMIPEELLDVQSPAFSNTLRWNIGHIVFCFQHFLSIGLPFQSDLPASYATLFQTGTKPSDWTTAPPSKDELIHYLSVQLELLSSVTPDELEAALPAPITMGPFQFTTVGEVFNFAVMHESIHLGIISSIVKVVVQEAAAK